MALGAKLTENGLVRIASGTALAMRAGVSRNVMKVHRMLPYQSEDITRKTAEMMGIKTTGQWGACETCFQAKVKRQAVQCIDGHKKTGSDGTGSDDRGMKSAGDGTIIERGTPRLNVQELGQEQQLTLHKHETQEAFSEREGETQGTFSKLEEETQKAPSMRAGVSRDVMKVHRMLAHPSEDITRKTAEMMGIETTGQWGACETCFQAKAKRQAVQWVHGHKKTGGDGTGSDDHGMKSAGDGIIVERGTPQLNVQELGQEQQLTVHEHKTQETFSEHEGETQGTFSKLGEETQEVLSEVEEEAQEALSKHEREQQQN